MRIIGGKYRGKRIIEYYNTTTRPTTDRVRENTFNTLSNMHIGESNNVILDLFAGTGAFGMECYSRFNAEVVFNDLDSGAVRVIKKNCESINCKSLILNMDYMQALWHLRNRQFDIIYLDPPYQSDFASKSIRCIVKNDMLKPDGIIIIESDKAALSPFNEEYNDFDVKEKIYGRTAVYFASYARKQ